MLAAVASGEEVPHGKPAHLLANLGLDGPGIAATVAKLLDAS